MDSTGRNVVVTGMGVISSIGDNIKDFEESLRAGRSGIRRLKKISDPVISVEIGAKLNNFSFESTILQHTSMPDNILQKALKCAARSPFTIQVAVGSVMEAWVRAELHQAKIHPKRVGLIIAGHNLSWNYQYNLMPRFKKAPEYLSPRYLLHVMDTDHIGTLSEIFNIHGEGFTVGGASASGNVGIIKGYQLIQSGGVDVCIVVAALTDLSPMELQGFYNLGVMGGRSFLNEPKKACRPFDKDHEGFIFGQGSGVLILESLESAKKRNIPILAEVSGTSINLDGNRLPDPNEEGEAKAMATALKRAKLKPNEVDYINSHGSSSPLGDRTELKAIRNVFHDQISSIWINSTKSLTGHCLYSAGVIEAIATIIQMEKGFLHPNINLVSPIDKEFRFCKKRSMQADIKIAMSNSFGFGGINTSIILRKGA